MKKLKRHYYDLNYPEAYTSESRLLKRFAKEIPREDILKFTQSQDVIQKYSEAHSRFKKRPFVAHEVNSIWAADTAVWHKHSAQNKGFIYIQIAVDLLSRTIYGFPMKNKKPESLVAGYKKIFLKAKPKLSIITDRGNEYLGVFKRFLKQHNIQHWQAHNLEKSSIAEARIKLLKRKLARYMYANNTKKWVPALDGVIRSINMSYTRNLGDAPSNINSKADQKRAFLALYGKRLGHPVGDSKFKEGDSVRISNFVNIFDKRYLKSFSEELYTVSKILPRQGQNVLTLKAHDGIVKGSFSEQEIRKVRT